MTIEQYIKDNKPKMVKDGMSEKDAEMKCQEEYKKKYGQEKMKAVDTVEMKDVEILAIGKWNSIDVKETDLNEMVENFKNGVIEPYLNLDHDDNFTDNVKKALSVVSLGFVSQLKKAGGRLIADFKEVPRKVAELIKSGMLKKRSVEFFRKNYQINGKAYNNVLKAVSFFGADIPAVNALSNDFRVLLKSETHNIDGSNNTEPDKIIFNKIIFKTGGYNMAKIEIDKSEYEDLVTFKASTESELTKFKAENETLKTEKSEIEVQLKDMKAENDKLVKLQKEYDVKKAADLKSEAETFISKIVEDGKILPKFKEDKVSDYIEKSVDAEKLSIFKEDLESRDKVLNLGEMKGEAETGAVDFENMDSDKIDEIITAKMKKSGKQYDEVAAELGIGG